MVKTGNKEESYNGYRIFLDIMTGEKLSLITLLTWDSFIGQIDHPVGKERIRGGIVILARCKFHFTREHENLV